jgi:hypothetical protein
VTPDATPPNVTLISPVDWFEAGKGNFLTFEYEPFDYNLDNCTLYIGPYNETLEAEVTNTSPVK